MKILILFICISIGCLTACNTKQDSKEPTMDSRLNPAEMPVDSMGLERANSDSNQMGNPELPPGKSELQEGGETGSNTTINSSGNPVRKDSANKTLPPNNR